MQSIYKHVQHMLKHDIISCIHSTLSNPILILQSMSSMCSKVVIGLDHVNYIHLMIVLDTIACIGSFHFPTDVVHKGQQALCAATCALQPAALKVMLCLLQKLTVSLAP